MTDPGTQGAPAGDPNAQPVTPPVEPAQSPASPEDLLKEVEKWKALSRKNEENAKANRSAAEELQALKDAQLSAEQKAQKAADKATAEAATAKAELARYRVAADKGVPVELLTASDEETLSAQADALLAFKGQSPPPAPDFGQGNRGTEPPQDPNAWIRAAIARH